MIGNSFPLSLVRNRTVTINERDVGALREMLPGSLVYSFWGHENTRNEAEAVLGVSLKPEVERPAIVLDGESLPMLGGVSFRECWVLSPDYASILRPEIGNEVGPGEISAWHALHLCWS